jgi:glucosamine-6-phosphate deaminase
MSGVTAPPPDVFAYGKAKVRIFDTQKEMGVAAAREARELIVRAIERRGGARIMVATGNSQINVVGELVKQTGIDWRKVLIFHMDEYLGIDANHPASFRRWIRERVETRVSPAHVNYIEGDAADVGQEIARYASLLAAGPLDVAFVGFGENGHIAFNDPPVADFNDPQMVKRVTLDAPCREQQVGEGHFGSVAEVPAEALTVSCSGLFRAQAWISCVPERRKAEAVRRALTGAIDVECPASLVQTHPKASVYLDSDSAALLNI